MADGFVGLLPLVSAPQGDESSVPGAAQSSSEVTGQARATGLGVGSAESWSYVASDQGAGWVGLWPALGLVNGFGAFTGSAEADSSATGERKAKTVQTGESFSASRVTGYNASLNQGDSGFAGLFPLVAALQGSTEVLPWGGAASYSQVEGVGVYSVMGDYATPSRSVFDLPPPADFKIPGLHLEYGIPTSLRAPGTISAEISGVSYVTGDLVVAIAATGEAGSASRATGQLRAVVVTTGEASSSSQVTGYAVGRISVSASGSASSASYAAGADGSLAEGVRLGTATADSAAAGEGLSESPQSGYIVSRSSATAVNASVYPLPGARGSASSASSAAGEAVAEIVRTASAASSSALAAVRTVLVLAEAAAFASAYVSGTAELLVTVSPGGRWPRNPRDKSTTRPLSGNTTRPSS